MRTNNKTKKNSKEFKNKFGTKKNFFTRKSVLAWIFAIIIILGMFMGYRNLEQRVSAYQKTIDELNVEIDELEENNASLEKEMEDVSSDEYIEKIARERLGMVKKDEYSLKQSDKSSDSDQ